MRLLQVTLALSYAHFACNSSSRSTEENDPSRSLGGVVYQSPDEPALALGAGPLYLTDVMLDGGYAGEIFTTRDAACKEKDVGILFEWNVPEYKGPVVQSHHGMRYLVASGKTLCFRSLAGQNKLVWAGTKL